MSSSLIRGKYVVCKVTGRNDAQVIEDGAVFQRDGVIVEVGPFAELATKHRPDEVLGSAEHVVLPGFVNSHHHVGLTPLPDRLARPPARAVVRAAASRTRDVDLYLDTLYSAFEMIESGVTTVQHLHSRRERPASSACTPPRTRCIKAYRDIGMRVSYSYGLRDQNRLVYEPDEDFVQAPAGRSRAEVSAMLARADDPARGQFRAVRAALRERYRGKRARAHPARARQPALVLGQGARALVRDCAESYRRADAHASAGDARTRRNTRGAAPADRGRASATSSACSART